MRKLAGAVVVGALCVALTACSPPDQQDPTPAPTFASVPTTSPTPQPGVDTPLASTTDRGIGYPIHMSVYDVETWHTVQGCECSAPGETTELYPADSVAWAIRVDLISDPSWAKDEGIDATALTLDSSWGPGAPVPARCNASTSPRSRNKAIAGAAAPTPGRMMRSASRRPSASRTMRASTPNRSSA